MLREGYDEVSEPGVKQERDKDSVANTLIVAISLSLIASILVATAAILLQPIQEKNEELFRQQIILDVAGLYSPGVDVSELFRGIDSRMVDLASGEYSTCSAEAGLSAFPTMVCPA